jgi:phosphate transport system protein
MSLQSSHIFRDFDNAIRLLKDDALLMASLTRKNLERSMRALLTRDLDLARAVIADDTEVDELEQKIDRSGMEIMTRFHPMASDLRLVVSTMKMASNLERISDHAVNIAKRAKKICKGAALEEVTLTEPLYSIAEAILRDALAAYTDGNTALGESLNGRDKELDKMHKKAISTLCSRLEEPSGRAESLLHLIFVVRSLERVGDLSVNIGEDAVFLTAARDIRHDSRKTSSTENSADGN